MVRLGLELFLWSVNLLSMWDQTIHSIMLQAEVKHQDFTVQLLQVLYGEHPGQLQMLNLLPAFPALSFHRILNQV